MKRKYSLFEKQADGSWKRISQYSFHKEFAVRHWQNMLLAHVLQGEPERCLKPVKI